MTSTSHLALTTLKPKWRGWWWSFDELSELCGIPSRELRALPPSFWSSNSFDVRDGHAYARRLAWDRVTEHRPRLTLAERVCVRAFPPSRSRAKGCGLCTLCCPFYRWLSP